MTTTWVRGPIGRGADRRITKVHERTVLVLVPHMAAGTRLLDFLPLIERDDRVQVVFTIPETWETWYGIEEFTRGQGGLVLPWQQVLHHHFDLALAASRSSVDEVQAPVLWAPHGAGGVRPRLLSLIHI